jgi:putative endonuclease
MSNESTRSVGLTAESVAAAFLEERGFIIVQRNFAAAGGEIDLIARDGETLVFVEVRSRASTELGDPIETITSTKRGRIVRAARAWLAGANLDEEHVACRFDVVTIAGEVVTHLADAFETNAY